MAVNAPRQVFPDFLTPVLPFHGVNAYFSHMHQGWEAKTHCKESPIKKYPTVFINNQF